MSLIPSILHAHDPWEIMRHNRHWWGWDNYGLRPPTEMFSDRLPISWRKELGSIERIGDDTVPHVGKDGFQVSVNVQLFRPSEITVKTIDNTVVIEGKHEERKDDHGYISRHFVRKYDLPSGYDSNDVNSSLSSDGFLTIKAPPPSKLSGNKERIIQIQHTGPAHLHVKDSSAMQDKENGDLSGGTTN